MRGRRPRGAGIKVAPWRQARVTRPRQNPEQGQAVPVSQALEGGGPASELLAAFRAQRMGALGNEAAGLELGATRLADGAQAGDLATAPSDAQQANTDPQVRARLSSSNAGQGGTQTDVPGPWFLPGTSENEAFVHDTMAVLRHLEKLVGDMLNGNASAPPSDDKPPPPAISPTDQTGSPTGPDWDPTQPPQRQDPKAGEKLDNALSEYQTRRY